MLSITSAQAENRDEVIFFFNDAQGSAVAAVNEAGELCWSEEYTAYGDKTINDDLVSPVGCGIVGEERGFTGHTEDVNSDLVYMQQRYYDPNIGRFLSIDPIEVNPNEPMTFNRYAYANNNPYKYTDPNGEIAIALLPVALPAIGKGLAALGGWLASAKGATIVTSASIAAYAASDLSLEPMLNESNDGNSNSDEFNPDDLSDKVGDIADKTGLTTKEVRDKIHEAKKYLPKSGPTRNPDVEVDTVTGEIYPQLPDGGSGDSIGNIFD